MTLAEDLLARHEGIREVLILEDKAGQHVVTEEAARDDVPLLLNSARGRSASMIPNVILGAAAQLGGTTSFLRLIGILYGKGGVLFSNINNDRLLAISTSPESFFNVMQIVNEVLPGLIEAYDFGVRAKAAEILPAASAERVARLFVANRLPKSARVMIDDVSYQAAKHLWQVCGSFRSGWNHSKHFQVEVDAYEGSLVRFTESPRSVYSSILFYVELASLLTAFSLLAWILYSNLLR